MKKKYLCAAGIALASALSLQGCQNTTMAQLPQRFAIPGASLAPVWLHDQPLFVHTSEQHGLSVVDHSGTTLAHVDGHYTMADVRVQSAQGTLIIAALDSNTYETDLLQYQAESGAFTVITHLPAGAADTEAVCLYQSPIGLQLFALDALGFGHQYLIAQQQLVNLRQFVVGPGTKTCSVADNTNTLYLADENVGIWAYDTHPEAEDKRTLITLPGELTPEGVAALPDGTLYAVSPDDNAIYQREHTQWSRIDIAARAPESISVARYGTSLAIGLYDDGNEKTIAMDTAAPAVNDIRGIDEADLSVIPVAETTPVNRFGDAADDPAIWINPIASERSLLLGTDKKGGLNVYNLQGQQLQHLPVGRVNNVDVRNQVRFQDQLVSVAVASNRSTNTLTVFLIDPESLSVTVAGDVATDLADVYGLCMYQHNGVTDVFVNSTDGQYRRYSLFTSADTLASETARFALNSQPEGCVADDQHQRLYLGEEQYGIWLMDLRADSLAPKLIASVNDKVHADIEGMALFDVDNTRYLIVSSQGNDRYGVYKAQAPYTLLGTFAIEADYAKGIDGSSETDGLDATSLQINPHFPDGLLVVQDGHNIMPSDNQNFKLVDGKVLAEAIRRLTSL